MAAAIHLRKEFHRLSWGYNAGLADAFIAAWGARAIFDGQSLDVVHDRTDWLGSEEDRKALAERMPTMDELRDLVRAQHLRPNVGEEVTLLDEDGLVIKANTQASYGYLYLVAYLEVPEAVQG